MTSPLRQALSEVRGNPRLRLGLIAIAGIVWVYALLVWRDAQVLQQQQIVSLREQADRLRPFERAESVWASRLVEARQLSAGTQSYLWEARTRSLAEAAFRDWLQARAQSAGLTVRELNVRTQDTSATGAPSTEPSNPSGAPLAVRARMIATFAPTPTTSFLLLMHSNKQHVGVQRVQLRNAPAGQESTLDLDLVAPFVIKEPKP